MKEILGSTARNSHAPSSLAESHETVKSLSKQPSLRFNFAVHDGNSAKSFSNPSLKHTADNRDLYYAQFSGLQVLKVPDLFSDLQTSVR